MSDNQMRARLYQACPSDHVSVDDGIAVGLVARRDIVRHLPLDRDGSDGRPRVGPGRAGA